MHPPEPTAEQGQWRLWGLEPDGSRLYNDKGVGYYAVINEDNIEVALTYTLDRAKAIIADHNLVGPMRDELLAEPWHVDIGDEGWCIESADGYCWGLNKNYGHPEDLGKRLNEREAVISELLAALREMAAAYVNYVEYTENDAPPLQVRRNQAALKQSRELLALAEASQPPETTA